MKANLTMSFRGRILIDSNASEDSALGIRGELVQNKPLICALSADTGLSDPIFTLQVCLYCSVLPDDANVALVWTSQPLEPIGRNWIS